MVTGATTTGVVVVLVVTGATTGVELELELLVVTGTSVAVTGQMVVYSSTVVVTYTSVALSAGQLLMVGAQLVTVMSWVEVMVEVVYPNVLLGGGCS